MTIQRINYGRGHSYKVDGVKYDGVTTLINKGLPKPALVSWAARSVAEHVADNLEAVQGMKAMGREAIVAALKEAPWTSRDTAAAKGTEVHGLAEKLTRGEKIQIPEHLTGYVESCIAFLDQWKVREVLVERTIANRKWRYAGTLDLVAEVADPTVGDVLALLDWKTGASGVWPEVSLQLAAYAHAEVYLADDNTEQTMPKVDAGYAVWLRSDGFDVYPVEIGQEPFKTFQHLAWLARRVDDRTGGMRAWLGDAIQREGVVA